MDVLQDFHYYHFALKKNAQKAVKKMDKHQARLILS